MQSGKIFGTAAAALTLLCLAGPAGAAAPAATPSAPATVTSDPNEGQTLRIRTVTTTPMTSKTGRQYSILVSAPQGPAPAGGFPVIYVLDGDGWFDIAVDIARMREYEKLRPALIVGVGYPKHYFFDAEGRSYDFTPPGSVDPDLDGIKLGGADEFLAFFQDTLKPWVKAKYQVDPGTQVLFGHSLGALFVLHALFTAPDSFNTFIAASPYLRFSDHLVMKDVAAFEANPQRKIPRLLATVGGLESHPSPGLMADYRRYYAAHPEVIPGETPEQAVAELFADNSKYDKAADLRALIDRLAKHGVKATFAQFDGEEHMSAAVAALNRGVPFALRPEE